MTTLTQDQMDGADDMGAHSQRVSESDLDKRIAEKQDCSTGCHGSCGQGRQACEWAPVHRVREAFTEVLSVGYEDDEPPPVRRIRLGGLSRFERGLLRRGPTYTWAGVVLFAVFAALVRGCA